MLVLWYLPNYAVFRGKEISSETICLLICYISIKLIQFRRSLNGESLSFPVTTSFSRTDVYKYAIQDTHRYRCGTVIYIAGFPHVCAITLCRALPTHPSVCSKSLPTKVHGTSFSSVHSNPGLHFHLSANSSGNLSSNISAI